MQETLDDAIWVLKNHAESSARSGQHASNYPPPHYPLGLTDQLQVSQPPLLLLLLFRLVAQNVVVCQDHVGMIFL